MIRVPSSCLEGRRTLRKLFARVPTRVVGLLLLLSVCRRGCVSGGCCCFQGKGRRSSRCGCVSCCCVPSIIKNCMASWYCRVALLRFRLFCFSSWEATSSSIADGAGCCRCTEGTPSVATVGEDESPSSPPDFLFRNNRITAAVPFLLLFWLPTGEWDATLAPARQTKKRSRGDNTGLLVLGG